jgi:hypothetical protein
MAGRGRIFRILSIVIGCYAGLLAGGVRWHWAAGPPYYQATLGLQFAFATVAALVGLASIWSAFAAVHWSTRASGLIAAVAAVAGVLTFFFEWNDFLVWQLIAIVYAQLACLIVALGVIRLCGYTLQRDFSGVSPEAESISARSSQFSVRNLLLLTTSLAVLFCVLHFSRPVELSGKLLAIVLLGGMCAAVVALVALWTCFSTAPIVIRIAVAVAIGPVGGFAYRAAEQYERLLMSGPWYAGVTAMQFLLMALPLVLVRMQGYRFMPAPRTQRGRSLAGSIG